MVKKLVGKTTLHREPRVTVHPATLGKLLEMFGL